MQKHHRLLAIHGALALVLLLLTVLTAMFRGWPFTCRTCAHENQRRRGFFLFFVLAAVALLFVIGVMMWVVWCSKYDKIPQLSMPLYWGILGIVLLLGLSVFLADEFHGWPVYCEDCADKVTHVAIHKRHEAVNAFLYVLCTVAFILVVMLYIHHRDGVWPSPAQVSSNVALVMVVIKLGDLYVTRDYSMATGYWLGVLLGALLLVAIAGPLVWRRTTT